MSDDEKTVPASAWKEAVRREAERRGMSIDEFTAHFDKQAEFDRMQVEFMGMCGVEVRGMWAAALLAQFAKPFKGNSEKIRKGGPIRAAIAKQLKKDPSLKNLQLFRITASKPPKGWTFYDNSAGVYIEGPGNKNMNYARFCNVCAEERGKLKA